MLRPDPAQLGRLTEITKNLEARLAEALDRGWLGEVEGLEASLAGARQKLAAMRRSSDPVATEVELGPPRFGPPPKK